ncbi:MAG: SusD/RagB family nutrient-binding outer membrane lipoprotein [Tannerellaceae bacterium]|nr:SusD/RagB family nutrient-binding outer membrane lipoprotein [Tannerellaceae bacterium]
MKKEILVIITSLCLMLTSTGCSDFGDLNVDPENITAESMDYTLLFTNVQVYTYGTEYDIWRNAAIYISSMIQHHASIDWSQGDKYTYNDTYNQAYWDRTYPNGILNAVTLIHQWKDDEEYQAEYNMIRILRVILMQRMTDMYGDVPYSEAGLGYIENIGQPKYDTQESIYLDMLNELKEAGEALASISSSKIGAKDIMYGGNTTQWRKLAYSLMVRVAMRLTKVAPDTASTWVNTALAGGIFESNDDNCIVTHEGAVETTNAAEPYGKVYSHEDVTGWRLSNTFVNQLKNTGDPRLSLIGTVVGESLVSTNQYSSGNWEYGDTTAVVQLGMPNGRDVQGGDLDISKEPNYPGTADDGYLGVRYYSVPNRYTFARPDAPTLVVTYSTIQLLLAEAAYRGYISGNAEEYYNEGVRAAIKQFTAYGVDIVTDAQINYYLSQNPYNASTALEQINVQYWIATYCDEYEAFANWRRSGYPVLTPVNYVGNVTNGTIPRRFTYNTGEAVVNTENYLEAVRRLNNGDTMTSRVWWDAE